MLLRIEGHHPPGRSCATYDDIHVGLQLGASPWALVPGDTEAPAWETEIDVVDTPDGPDFRGSAVQGKRGQRFVYLTWGEGAGEAFTMFRRAKLMLSDLPDARAERVTARVHLTDENGMPRCARLRPPALTFEA